MRLAEQYLSRNWRADRPTAAQERPSMEAGLSKMPACGACPCPLRLGLGRCMRAWRRPCGSLESSRPTAPPCASRRRYTMPTPPVPRRIAMASHQTERQRTGSKGLKGACPVHGPVRASRNRSVRWQRCSCFAAFRDPARPRSPGAWKRTAHSR
jgi:hypothetical protein